MNYLQLTVYLNEADRMGEVPLHEEVIRRLLRRGVVGATVMRGWMGYGRRGTVHRRGLFGVSDDRPVLVTAVDEASRIRATVPELREILPDGLMTVSPVEVL